MHGGVVTIDNTAGWKSDLLQLLGEVISSKKLRRIDALQQSRRWRYTSCLFRQAPLELLTRWTLEFGSSSLMLALLLKPWQELEQCLLAVMGSYNDIFHRRFMWKPSKWPMWHQEKLQLSNSSSLQLSAPSMYGVTCWKEPSSLLTLTMMGSVITSSLVRTAVSTVNAYWKHV